MPSRSLEELTAGLGEVALIRAELLGRRRRLSIDSTERALGRSCVVLLVSHLEAYIYGLTEQLCQHIHDCGLLSTALPERLRLRHTKGVVEELSATAWERRADKLREFVQYEAPLWDSTAASPLLNHERLLAAMKTPRAKPLVAYFSHWGVDDVFSAVTRSPTTRARLRLTVGELGQKRNDIAHGDYSTEATPGDVARYLEAVRILATRVDRLMARRVVHDWGLPQIW